MAQTMPTSRHKPRRIAPGSIHHMLYGDYKGHMECHVQNDLLLIWFDRTSDTVVLVRFGSHSELF